MPLPATEDFTGGAANLDTSASWTQNRGRIDLTGSGGAAGNSTTHQCYHWDDDSFADNQYSETLFSAVGGSWQGVTVRAHTTGGTETFYLFDTNVSEQSYLVKYVAGIATTLAQVNETTAIGSTDVLRVEADGTTLTPSINGTTADMGAQTDSAITSGSAGVGGWGFFNTLDSWEGGDLDGGGSTITGSGIHQAENSISSGVGERIITGSGSHQSESAISSGIGERTVTGSGASQALTSLSSGNAERVITGSGDNQASTSTGSGAAERIITGLGSHQSENATSVGTVERVIVGSGSHQAETSTSLGIGTGGGISTGSGAHQSDTATGSGLGERSIVGSGSNRANYATSTGVALRVITGSGSHQANAAISAGNDIILSDIDKDIIFSVHVTKEYNNIIYVTRERGYNVKITKELFDEVYL